MWLLFDHMATHPDVNILRGLDAAQVSARSRQRSRGPLRGRCRPSAHIWMQLFWPCQRVG